MSVPPFVTRVRSYELDALGHVNHAVYLNWFEQARYDALEAAGLSPAELLRREWGIHVVRIEVDYRAECRLGDEVEIRTGIDEVRNSSMTLVQSLIRRREEGPSISEGGPLPGREAVRSADARVVAVWIGADRRPMRIPPQIRERFRSWDALAAGVPPGGDAGAQRPGR
jgi:YbgC/YbaW family acyl-CoA thioester hydrolase